MNKQSIAFIGGGNMARSLIGGLIAAGHRAQDIWVAEPDKAKCAWLQDTFAINTTEDNIKACSQADLIVLAVKPQVMQTVASELTDFLADKTTLVLSIAAGIRTGALASWLGDHLPIVRAMPNTPAQVQSGATAMYATNKVSHEQHELAESLMRGVGLALWVDDEALMDTVTALSGSGPAYFFLVMEALEDAAVELGLSPQTARLLTIETAFGAAKMALESSDSCAALRQAVTSPGGTTERALNTLENGKLRELFKQALAAARTRSIELAEQLGEH